MSLREKKKLETKNRIFEVSGRLFKEKGFENTTVNEITKEAGIAKGTFFNYFPTKEALLMYFGEQKEELIYDLIEKDKALTKLLLYEYHRNIMHTGLTPDEPKSSIYRLNKILCDFLDV